MVTIVRHMLMLDNRCLNFNLATAIKKSDR